MTCFTCYATYRLSPLMSREQFLRQSGETDLTGEFYMRLLDHRTPRLVLELVVESEDERADFERKWCGAPVALRGIRLQAREPGGDLLAGALDRQVVEALTERFLPMLIVPPDSVGAMIGSPARHQPVGAAAYRPFSRWLSE